MVIEANALAGYVVDWVMAQVRRNGAPPDADAGRDKIHRLVVRKLGDHPALLDAEEEAGDGNVSELTRQQIELAITAAARKDDEFAAAVTAALAELRTGRVGTRIFTGDANADAQSSGVAIGQVGGDVYLNSADPPPPGRSLP
ncbi:chromosome partitioning protein [Micromonospora andamanensis]|nr:chromosome partitioning protein [Micromonospora andamanensis]